MATEQGAVAPWTAESLAQLKTMRDAGEQMPALMLAFPDRSASAITRALVKMIRTGQIESRSVERRDTAPVVGGTKRRCLGGCGRMRDSKGPGDRICRNCKGTEAWRSGGDAALSGVRLHDR